MLIFVVCYRLPLLKKAASAKVVPIKKESARLSPIYISCYDQDVGFTISKLSTPNVVNIK